MPLGDPPIQQPPSISRGHVHGRWQNTEVKQKEPLSLFSLNTKNYFQPPHLCHCLLCVLKRPQCCDIRESTGCWLQISRCSSPQAGSYLLLRMLAYHCHELTAARHWEAKRLPPVMQSYLKLTALPLSTEISEVSSCGWKRQRTQASIYHKPAKKTWNCFITAKSWTVWASFLLH